MNLIRISDDSTLVSDRLIYRFIENLDTFTLKECSKKKSICLHDLTDVLVLDHFDEADDPNKILADISSTDATLKTIIIVDRYSDVPLKFPQSFRKIGHLVFKQGQIKIIKSKDIYHVRWEQALDLVTATRAKFGPPHERV